ncbi:MAG: addiction module protein [Methylobacter sp.]|nr:addiction module protein [Candidatus Methylobacter titanis]
MLNGQELYQQVSHLPSLEKLRLAELLLADLDTPNLEIDAIWREAAQETVGAGHARDIWAAIAALSPLHRGHGPLLQRLT